MTEPTKERLSPSPSRRGQSSPLGGDARLYKGQPLLVHTPFKFYTPSGLQLFLPLSPFIPITWLHFWKPFLGLVSIGNTMRHPVQRIKAKTVPKEGLQHSPYGFGAVGFRCGHGLVAQRKKGHGGINSITCECRVSLCLAQLIREFHLFASDFYERRVWKLC